MRRTSMEQEIRRVIATKAVREPASIGRYDDFEEDLGLDSLDRLDLLAEVEDELDVRISEDRLSAVRNLDGLVKAVDAQLFEEAA